LGIEICSLLLLAFLRYYALNTRTDKIQEHLTDKRDLIELIDKEGKISKDIILPMKGLGVYGLRGKQRKKPTIQVHHVYHQGFSASNFFEVRMWFLKNPSHSSI